MDFQELSLYCESTNHDLAIERETSQVSAVPKDVARKLRTECNYYAYFLWYHKYLSVDSTYLILNHTWKYLENPSQSVECSGKHGTILKKMKEFLDGMQIFSVEKNEERKKAFETVQRCKQKFLEDHLRLMINSTQPDVKKAALVLHQEIKHRTIRNLNETFRKIEKPIEKITNDLKNSFSNLSVPGDLHRNVRFFHVHNKGENLFDGSSKESLAICPYKLSAQFLSNLAKAVGEDDPIFIEKLDLIVEPKGLSEFMQEFESHKPRMNLLLKLYSQGIFGSFFAPTTVKKGGEDLLSSFLSTIGMEKEVDRSIFMTILKSMCPNFDQLSDEQQMNLFSEYVINQSDDGFRFLVSISGDDVVVTSKRVVEVEEPSKDGKHFQFEIICEYALDFRQGQPLKNFRISCNH